MSFGLGHGKPVDPAIGVVLVGPDELPPLPDEALTDRSKGRLDPRRWFEHPERELDVEIGSGKGTFLIQQAELEPEVNFLGFEWAGEFCRYAADRVRRRREAGRLGNVRLVAGDATEFIVWRCPDAIVRKIHLYFSDPWPKTRHHKKRVVQDHTLAEFWRILRPGGELLVVTDHAELWAWDETHFAHWTGREHDSPARRAMEARGTLPPVPFERTPFDGTVSAGDGELVGTNFERKFRAEGRSFHACTLVKLVET